MRKKTNLRLILFVVFFVAASTVFCGCQKRSTVFIDRPPIAKDYSRPLPAGELALRKINDPEQIPDYKKACANLDALVQAIDHSLSYMAKPSSKNFYPYGAITHAHAVKSLEALQKLAISGKSPDEINNILHEKFDTYISVGCDDRGTVLYTGYYTPIFNGSFVQNDRFQYPLYKSPDNLVKDSEGMILGQRDPDGRMRLYPGRRDIKKSDILAGNEIIWLEDPFEVYIVHVQGSAHIRMPDGTIEAIHYDAHNGWDYVSIVPKMIADGKLSAASVNLKTMIQYFKTHPEEIDHYVNENPRFVFFRRGTGAPRGSINVPVTPFRTLATDKSIYPRAMLAFAAVDLESPVGFALDQDTGGAIRAAGRCDVYMGIGDRAGELAGGTYREGKLYYLFLKP